MQAFEKEGIRTITALRDQLLASEGTPAASRKAIEDRHAGVMARWERLKRDSEQRRERLLSLQDQYRRVEELYLTFAKKASAFNSWFENAEEDLTDPVRCNSLDEIHMLRDAHQQFKVRIVPAL